MTAHAERLPRYKQLREAGLRLNNKLVKTLSRSVMGEGGRKLGILEGNELMLDTEDEMAVLMDYCVHDVRRYGLNAVERYLQSSPPPADSDEWVLLQALRVSRFSLFAIESIEKGVGVQVRDLLRDETLFLTDVSLGSSAWLGMVLASRLMAPEGITMTSGAALPADTLAESEYAEFVEELQETFGGVDFRNMAPEEANDLTATVLRTCLAEGAAERIAYVKPDEKKPRGKRTKRAPKAKRPKRK
jgi:hypothetical protein